jgi:hypothetical protein
VGPRAIHVVRKWIGINHHDLVEGICKDTRGEQAGYTCANHNRVPTSIRNLSTVVLWNGC